MKRIFLLLLLVSGYTVKAQYNNSWIDYNKAYYKFYLGKDTLCRIPQATLANLGLSGVNADHFQLWRNGKEVRLFTSVSNATFGPSDFIEFWGKANDGKPDKELYRDPSYQLSDRYSLETDTVAYFLTVNPAGGNLRFVAAANGNPGSMVPDAYYMRTINVDYRNQINRGRAEVIGEYVFSSSYDEGEGYTSWDTAPCCDQVKELFGLNVYTAGPANSVSFHATVSGNAPNSRNVQIKLFQNIIYDSIMNYFNSIHVSRENQPLSLLQNPGYLPVYFKNTSSESTDRFVVAHFDITYPSTFNFNGEKNVEFSLEPSATGNYLVIDNVGYGSVPPVLFDYTSGARYVGDISGGGGQVKFVLPPSTQTRSMMLVNEETANIYNIPSATQRNFVNYLGNNQQADYIIISHPALFNDGNGNNFVDQYRAYRASVAGGSYNAKVYDINELTDQFGFGIKFHPASIRSFLLWASANFSVSPKYCFIIGRGLNYMEQKAHETSPIAAQENFVPTFGWPASDMLLASLPGQSLPVIPIGRLSVVNGLEISNYLTKIQQYEQVQASPSSSIDDKLWMKKAIHVAGGKNNDESFQFQAYMNGYRNIYQDTLLGGNVETFTKTSSNAVQQAASDRIEYLFDQGLGFIGYFGHSSASTFEFNLSDPQIYNNAGKYPFFNVSGCSAGNFYIFDPLRLNGNLSLSEKYVLANQRGSIGFLADTHFGIPTFLDFFNSAFYTAFSKTMYGNSVGNQLKQVHAQLDGANVNINYFMRIHLEQITLHGDPALKINYFAKPDYAIEDSKVKISPNIITVADNSFHVDIRMDNIGKATNDSIWVSVERRLPNDSVHVLYRELRPGIKYEDSLILDVPINPITDKGLNKLVITLDEGNRVDETYETNNSLTKEFYIFEDELRPVSPYNFSIVNNSNITYYANTANPLSGQRDYVMEVDTTNLFNSPFKKTYNKTGPGGIVEFSPTNIPYTDSTVYYWRVAMVPTGTAQYIWNAYSFIYLPNSSSGFNQSHYYQHLKDNFNSITLDTDRKFHFNQTAHTLTIRTGLYPYYLSDRINVNMDFEQLELYGCRYNSIQFYVFDPNTLEIWKNRNTVFSGPTPIKAMYGSYPVCQLSSTTDTTRNFFEYPYYDATYRASAMNFIDQIPDGMYVAITNLGNKNSNTSFINQWKNDTLALGSGNSLYHKLKSIGFSQIDSFYHNVPFLYFFRKGVSGYTPTSIVGLYDSSYIDHQILLNSTSSEGQLISPVYGPALSWTALHWRGNSSDVNPANDITSVEVWGIKNDGSENQLATVYQAQDTALSFINAQVYPNIRLKFNAKDTINYTPYQLRYLRVNASYVPEGSVAPNLLFTMRDTASQGEMVNMELAFKNISSVNFDSLMKIRLRVTDKNNVTTNIDVPKGKILPAGDTLVMRYNFDTRNFSGLNTVGIEFNPDNDQPEQSHFNNFLFKSLYVREDKFNPLLDVTFDGVHILNKDIVSAKPFILIKLKDENRFVELKDTALLKVSLRLPDGTLRTYHFDGDTLQFIPANLASGSNTATIEFRPVLEDASFDEPYELIVSGKDMAGNRAGMLDYHVLFTVINTPMISNMLNYPNPFTTSTAFVFTLTGSEVPQNIRIQILTITGKIVKEIKKEELGPLHIGRNITEYKWDGTDMYGQKLANGVYLYRVITNLNGKKLDKYRSEGDNTDKYFKKGYGKMYLMR